MCASGVCTADPGPNGSPSGDDAKGARLPGLLRLLGVPSGCWAGSDADVGNPTVGTDGGRDGADVGMGAGVGCWIIVTGGVGW